MKEMLDSAQAAHYLRLARQTLAKLRCTGGSPLFYKVGRQVLYDRADLDTWLDARKRRSTSDSGSAPQA
jgi:excisionase family DNA binding protein